MQAGISRLGADLLVFALATTIVTGFTYVQLRRDFEHEWSDTRERISAAADSRREIVSNWLIERRGDAEVLAAHPSVRSMLSSRPRPEHDTYQLETANHLAKVAMAYGYNAVEIQDPDGATLTRASSGVALAEAVRDCSRRSATSQRLQLEIVVPDAAHAQLVICAPIYSTGGSSTSPVGGVVCLVMDAATRLVPLVASAGFQLETEETLLVARTRGRDDVLYLTPVKTDLGAPAIARRRWDPALAGAVALGGTETFGEFRDYRDAGILAATRVVSLAGLGLVHKVDREEAFRSYFAARRGWWGFAVLLLVLLAVALIANRRRASAELVRERQQRDEQMRKAEESAERERREAADARLRLVAQMQRLMDSAGDGIYALDPDGRCTIVNRAAAGMLGWEPADLVGCQMHATIHHTRVDGTPYSEEQCPVLGTIRRRAGVQVDDELFWRKDGTSFPIRYSAFPIVEGDVITGTVVVFNDISERKAIDAQLRESQKLDAASRLAAGLSHDFNNLLTAITGHTELLKMDLTKNARLTARADSILRAATEAATLTRQLLAFSRGQVLSPVVIDLNDLLKRIWPVMARVVGEEVELAFDPCKEPRPIRVDPAQIEQALLTLAMNARERMIGGGCFTICTRNVDAPDPVVGAAAPGKRWRTGVMLSLSDTGEAMSPEAVSRAFQPFVTAAEKWRGYGLGLASVHGIVTQNGGGIGIVSEQGRGTTFQIYFPMTEGQVEPVELAPRASGTQVAGGTVLLAEDEDAVRRMARDALELNGFHVIEACDGREALRKAAVQEGRVDILVTDVVMPEIGGRELASRMLARNPALKVLYISGYADDKILREGVSRKDFGFLQKPFSPSELTNKVRAILGRDEPSEPD